MRRTTVLCGLLVLALAADASACGKKKKRRGGDCHREVACAPCGGYSYTEYRHVECGSPAAPAYYQAPPTYYQAPAPQVPAYPPPPQVAPQGLGYR